MEFGIQLSTTNYVPEVGLRGHYKLLPPFNTLVDGIQVPSGNAPLNARTTDTILMTCKSVEKISVYIGNGVDIYSELYEPFGLTENDFAKDQKEDVNIITLWSDGGVIVKFPGRYLASYPNTNGVGYLVNHIHVILPAFPHNFDFSQVLTDIQTKIQSRLGIPKAKVKLVRASEIQMVDEEVHLATKAKRKNDSEALTPELEVIRLNQLVSDLERERDDLLEYIENNIPPL